MRSDDFAHRPQQYTLSGAELYRRYRGEVIPRLQAQQRAVIAELNAACSGSGDLHDRIEQRLRRQAAEEVSGGELAERKKPLEDLERRTAEKTRELAERVLSCEHPLQRIGDFMQSVWDKAADALNKLVEALRDPERRSAVEQKVEKARQLLIRQGRYEVESLEQAKAETLRWMQQARGAGSREIDVRENERSMPVPADPGALERAAEQGRTQQLRRQPRR